MNHAVDVVLQTDEQAELGGVLDFALDGRAHRMGSHKGFPGIGHGLLEAQRDTALGGIDVQHDDIDFLAGGNDLARVDVLLGPGHFGHVDQTLDAGFQLNKRAVVGDVGDAAGELGTHRVLGFHAVPRVGLELLHAQRDALRVRVDLDDLHLDGVAHGQNLARVVDALPAHVSDVQQAVDAAQVHERTVVGDVLDDAVADFAFLQLADQFGALFGAGFFQDRAARDHDVTAGAVHLEDREGLFLAHQRADIAYGTDVNLRTRQERRGAAQVDGEAALHAADDGTHHRLVLLVDDLEARPGFFAAGLFAADDRFAHGILDALQEHLDAVADLGRILALAFADAEFLQRNPAFGLQTDVDDREVLFDGHHQSVDHLAFHKVTSAKGLVEQCCEIIAGGRQAHIVGHRVFHLQMTPGPRTSWRRTESRNRVKGYDRKAQDLGPTP